MSSIPQNISSSELISVSDYIKAYKRIEKEVENTNTHNDRILKIALLSSFTTNGFKETLYVKCCELGIAPDIYTSNYNQYYQEIIEPDSPLYNFNPDLVFLFIDIRALLGDNYLLPYQLNDTERQEWVQDNLQDYYTLVDTLKGNTNAKIVVHNLEVPLFSPLGILEQKQEYGFIESIESFNKELREDFKKDSRVFVFDYDAFCSKIGKQNILDYKMYYLGDIKVNMQYIPQLCDEYIAYIKPVMSMNKKCIVLDLDNTLWGGIIGEDKIEGIRLGPTPEGRPFLEFQRYLLSLFNRGIILAINSNNNYDDAMEVLRKHPHMVLKEDHFAAIQINWENKISKMQAIAEELNIGLDSLVFLDDDKSNREMVKDALPDVKVVNIPEDPSLYLQTLIELNDFNSFYLTEEDKVKGKMYAEQRKRNEFKKTATDITEHLKGLGMEVTFEPVSKFNCPRIAQLTQRTNQFNMTTKRYMEEDIERFNRDENFLISAINVKDKFGDNGLVGAAIVCKKRDSWAIDTFLLSCRVIGRRVEETLLAYIIKMARQEGANKLIGYFSPTKKNKPASEFYKNCGFELESKDEARELWTYDLNNNFEYPDFIRVNEG